MWLLQLRSPRGVVRAAQGRWAVTSSTGLITLKGHLLLAPHSAALSLQVTEWGGFYPSCSLGELGGYKKRRRWAAGRQRRTKASSATPERREERQQAVVHPLTDISMGSFSAITASFLLFLAFQLPGQSRANPVYSSVSNAELMDFKNLLDHLEDKMPLEDEVMPPQVLSEQNEEAGAALSPLPEVPPWTGEVNPAQRDGGALGRGPWDSLDRSALLKNKLRALLTAPRSLRRSSCFGGRMDRIGAQSGLGCNSFRYRR